ncbi:MAG: hypothetical protein IPO01_13505 [Chitinophagaceae bacterium]|nr:hypothetical protein [Chitinophagaceae bacterium]
MQLTGGGGGSGGGGGGTSSSQAIFWIASDLGCGPINVTCNGVTKQITAYTSSAPNCSLSVEMTAKNNCTQNIKIYCCIQRTDWQLARLARRHFGKGVSPNGTAQWFVCKGTGQYKIFAMPVATFNSNNCSYPNCN